MGFVAKVKETKYRLTMRKALQNASIEELKICKEELTREFNRRTKENGTRTITRNIKGI